jgi:hypothetical protein
MPQKNAYGVLICGIINIASPVQICKIANNLSAFIQRSATIPINAGMKSEAIPMVEKIIPNSVASHPLL